MRYDVFEYAIAVESSGASGQDRAVVVHVERGLLLALADGAGGTAHGARAADAVSAAVQHDAAACADPCALLHALDDPARLGGGQTTAVIASVIEREVRGASVGDSGAWIVERDAIIDLTRAQQRKPLLGAGCAPVAFAHQLSPGSTLLVASDGLLRYARPADIARIASTEPPEIAVAALVDLVRLPTGRLQDDISIVLCRCVRVAEDAARSTGGLRWRTSCPTMAPDP